MSDTLNNENNIFFREAARKVAEQFLDRPLKAIDTANYWIEYTVKYGWDALRSPAMDFNWWEVDLLDVYAFLLLVTIAILYVTIRIILMLLRMVLSNANFKVIRAKKMS